MRILIAGANGQLGRELSRLAESTDFTIAGFGKTELDITDAAGVKKTIFETRPDIVVNGAAYTKVDEAESRPNEAFSANRDGPANLAEACSETGIPLIHISTDFVFDGKKRRPYVETDPVSPTSVYGKSKVEGEDEIRSRLAEHIVIRTSWLYSAHGRNFVKTMLEIGKKNDVIRVVDDQWGSPTSATDLAESVLATAGRIGEGVSDPWGTYHYSGAGETTWHGFAEKIFETAANLGIIGKVRVLPIPTSEYPVPAPRPPYSVLDCRAVREKFGIVPKPWEESLEKTLIRDFPHPESA